MKHFFYTLLLASSALAGANSFANDKTICGMNDDRIPSYNPKIARASSKGQLVGCTVTMIGKSCAVSAGHCVGSLEKLSFNVPENNEGLPVASAPEDTYLRSKDYLRYKDQGAGNDWAVIKIEKNEITGKFPGEVQGHYGVHLEPYGEVGDIIRITGHGHDTENRDKAFIQQTHTGEIIKMGKWFNKSYFEYRVDTMGGNSGSSIIHEQSQKIIGIHTHGGCRQSGTSGNMGTILFKNDIFREAVRSCLEWEKQL